MTTNGDSHQGPEHAHRLEYRPLGEIATYPRNPKAHSIGQIKASIARFGFVAPLLVNISTNELLAGHGRLEALIEMKSEGNRPPDGIRVDEGGEWLVPVITGLAFDAEEHAAYILADNRIGELGGWNDDALAELLEFLEQGEGLAGTGFTDAVLQDLLDGVGKTEADPESEHQVIIPAMELQPFESWDYVVFMFRDARDFQRIQGALGIDRVNSSLARTGKRAKIGLGRVVDGRVLLRLLDRDHEPRTSGLNHDAQDRS